MTWNLTTLLVLMAVLFLGYFIGLWEGRWQHNRQLKAAQQERDAARKELEALEARLGQPSEGLWVAPSGKMWLDGQRLRPSALTTAQEQRLRELIRPLQNLWAATGPESGPKPAPSPRPAASPKAAIPENTPSAPAAADVTAFNLVEQIDRVLQQQIAGTALDHRGIRLEASALGEVTVWVGLTRYESVDAVPDPVIQQAIRTAIRSWEEGAR